MDPLPARLVALLENVAWSKRHCRHCDALLYLVRTNGAITIPYSVEGRNHQEDCPRYTQPPAGSQERLFGETAPEAFEPRR